MFEFCAIICIKNEGFYLFRYSTWFDRKANDEILCMHKKRRILAYCDCKLDLTESIIAQCLYRQSHAYMVKIPMTYHKAPTTKFRLFWDADSWNFSNIKTINAFRTLWLLPVLAPFFKVSIVKNQRFYSVANSQLVPNDFQLLKALSHLGLMWK